MWGQEDHLHSEIGKFVHPARFAGEHQPIQAAEGAAEVEVEDMFQVLLHVQCHVQVVVVRVQVQVVVVADQVAATG